MSRKVNIFNQADRLVDSFISAASITSTTERKALTQLVADLRAANLISKMIFCYPMIGGTLTSCSYNLINTSQYQITWFNSPTASATGVKGNGTTQYGLTGIVADTALSNFNAHLSYYSRNSVNALGGLLSSVNTAGTSVYGVYTFTGPNMLAYFGDSLTGINTAVTNTSGLLTASRTSSSLNRAFRNTVRLASQTNTVVAYNSGGAQIGILCENRPAGPPRYSAAECAFACGGTGLTDAEVASLYSAVQTFQTSLNRQV